MLKCVYSYHVLTRLNASQEEGKGALRIPFVHQLQEVLLRQQKVHH
jgi:hypothetical protein